MAQPIVTVAVVSWNTRELLRRCLRSLEPEVDAGRAEVWVADNASSDGSPELVRSEAPWATLLETGSNLGFGAAVNAVARRTGTPWLAAANADIALAPGALETLLWAGEDGSVGAVGPQLVLPDGRTQHSVYAFPTLPYTLLVNLAAGRVSRRLADHLCLEGYWDSSRPRPVDWVIGAFVLLRRTAFEAAGRFDEAQWLFAEDLDLGYRLRDAGYFTRYEPRAVVHHAGSAATSAAFGPEQVTRHMAATYAALARRHGLARTRALGAVNLAGAATRVAIARPLRGRSRRWAGREEHARHWLSAHREVLRPGAELLHAR